MKRLIALLMVVALQVSAVVPTSTTSITYPGVNGTTTSFAVPFRVQKATDLLVTVDGNVQAISSSYTVSVLTTTATVRFIRAPATGTTVVITRQVPFLQLTEFRSQGSLTPKSLTDTFDNLEMQIQQNFQTHATDRAAQILKDSAQDAALAVGAVGGSATMITATGTSASRSAADRFLDLRNLKDFSPPCNGINDDSVALLAAINALPASGGRIDARSCSGGMSLNAMSITKQGVTILFPAATVRLNGYLDILSYSIHLVGVGIATTLGSDSTTISVATTAGVRVGNASTPVWNWSIEKMSFTPQSGATPAFGVQLQSARQGYMDHVSSTAFNAANAAGVLQLENCWSNRYIEVQVISNDIGFAYLGSQANADIHIGGFYNLNRIGILVTLGGSSGSSAGIYVMGSPQFEGNTDTGIRLQSGSIQGFHVWGGYSELLSGAKRFLTAQGDGTNILRLGFLDIAGTSVLDQGTLNPVLLDSTKNASDYVNAHVELYGYNMTGGANALVDAIGGAVLARVDGKALGVSSIVPLHTSTSGARIVSAWVDAAGYTFRNNSDTGFNLNIDSGATTAQSTTLAFKDRGTTKHSITSVGGALFFAEAAGALNKIILSSGGNPTIINAGLGGSGSSVQVNATANSGSGGLEVWGGGATPTLTVKMGLTNGAGVLTLTAGTVTQGGVPTGCRAICTDTTAANPVRCSVVGNNLTITGTGTDVINYFCF